VPQWNSRLTPVCYLGFSLASGFLPAAAIAAYAGLRPFAAGAIAALLVAAAWAIKTIWWNTALRRSLADRGSTPESATGLGFIGRVRLFERPHTGENYLTREMVHVIGRKHAFKLRWIALFLGAALPFLIAAAVALAVLAPAWLGLAVLAMAAGLFVERWLFFAEATHAVSLYYGRRGA
jgi:DMSO reductase anchor subunit